MFYNKLKSLQKYRFVLGVLVYLLITLVVMILCVSGYVYTTNPKINTMLTPYVTEEGLMSYGIVVSSVTLIIMVVLIMLKDWVDVLIVKEKLKSIKVSFTVPKSLREK